MILLCTKYECHISIWVIVIQNICTTDIKRTNRTKLQQEHEISPFKRSANLDELRERHDVSPIVYVYLSLRFTV